MHEAEALHELLCDLAFLTFITIAPLTVINHTLTPLKQGAALDCAMTHCPKPTFVVPGRPFSSKQ